MSDELDEKGLLAKIEALLRQTPKPDAPHADQPIPHHRADAWRKRAEAAEEALELQKKAHKAELKRAREEYAADLGRRESAHAEDIKLRDLGLDDDGRAEVQRQWSRQPDGGRPGSPSEFWAGLLEANKAHQADPENTEAPAVPKTLALYLPQPDPPKQDEPQSGARVQDRPRIQGVRVGLTPDRNAQPRQRDSDGSATRISQAGDPESFWKAVAEADRG